MTEQERLAAEWVEYMEAETDEDRERVRSSWSGEKTAGLVIPAKATNEDAAALLYRLLVKAGPQGIRPSEALAELRGQGHEYKHTGERLRRLLRAAEGTSTGRGRGSLWRLDN